MAMSNPLNFLDDRRAMVEALNWPRYFRILKNTSTAMSPKIPSVATWEQSPTIIMLFPTDGLVPREAMTAPRDWITMEAMSAKIKIHV